MPTGGRTTLVQYLIEERRRHPEATGDLNALITDVALACKAISRKVAFGGLAGVLGSAGSGNVQGEEQKTLDVLSNQIFLRANEWGGHVAAMASEELDDISLPPGQYPRGKYLLAFDPLDGSSNIDVNVSVGSIFSITHAPDPDREATTADFLQPGREQVCAGYAIYGPSTMLVITLGSGTHGFTLDPVLGEWVLSHPDLKVPRSTREFAINASNSRFWEPAVRRYVDECLAGRTGPREADFNMRWIASLVAETFRVLTRGGVIMYPEDTMQSASPGRISLMYEANPIAFLVEQAGGEATNGRQRIMELTPRNLQSRTPLIFGSREEVQRIVRYHNESDQGLDREYTSPLFNSRGLFSAF